MDPWREIERESTKDPTPNRPGDQADVNTLGMEECNAPNPAPLAQVRSACVLPEYQLCDADLRPVRPAITRAWNRITAKRNPPLMTICQ